MYIFGQCQKPQNTQCKEKPQKNIVFVIHMVMLKTSKKPQNGNELKIKTSKKPQIFFRYFYYLREKYYITI